jgi:hypothetical protein
MKSVLRRVAFSHPVGVVFAGILWGALFVMIGLYATRDETNGLNVIGRVPGQITIVYELFFLASFVVGIVLLFKREFLIAACYLFISFAGDVPICALQWLKGDRFVFTSGPHGELGEIYAQRRSEFTSMASSSPRLIALDNQCHPPADCECWIVLDPTHTSGIEQDIGGWHAPKSLILPVNTLPPHFAIVDVRRLDEDAYSVLGCGIDCRSWNPV